MKDATICYLFKDNQVLLQKKAEGKFGAGKWNAPGGKIKMTESPETAIMREIREETGLTVKQLKDHGKLAFGEKGGHAFSVYVFSATDFSGELKANEEGELKWFPTKNLPWNEMWKDDKIWLPALLEGKRFHGRFMFDKGFKKMLDYHMEEL